MHQLRTLLVILYHLVAVAILGMSDGDNSAMLISMIMIIGFWVGRGTGYWKTQDDQSSRPATHR